MKDKTKGHAMLENALRTGQISRREFLGQTAALSAGIALAGSPLLANAAPKRGGKLRYGLGHGSTTDSLDPATFENNFMGTLGFTSHNHLAEVTATGELIPEVAESWEASPDAKKWVFKIRSGVEFHNGKSLTASDVVNSVNHHRGDDSKSAAKTLLKQIENIQADGDNVVVDLSAGNADFPFVISDYHVAILPTKDGKADWREGVGLGSYALTDFEPGVRASFKKHANFFKSDRAHFDEVSLLSIIDTSARTNALQTGEIDVMDRCDLKTVHLLARTKGIKVKETTGTAHYTIPMRTDMSPFDNNHIRMALKLGLDREALLKTVLRGHGIVGNDHPISPSNRYHASHLEQRTYDPDKARFHLKQAGLDSIKVDLSAADAAFAGAVDAAVLYKEHAAKAGIEINLIREPNDGYWSNVWMKKAWCFCYWGGRPTEDWMFSTAYSADAAWNDAFWKHDKFNQLLLDARAELDDAKRRSMYGEMQSILRDEGGTVVPLFNNYVFATTDKLTHPETLGGNWDMDGGKLMERWWYA